MKSKTEKTSNVKPRRTGTYVVVGAFLLMSGIIWVSLQLNQRPPSGPAAAGQPSLIATLSPELFTGKAREAYQAAKDIPAILQHLPCFCGCFGLGHQNNLFCFADKHGEDCDMCQDIALDAKQMYSDGMPLEKIAQAIRARYSPVR